MNCSGFAGIAFRLERVQLIVVTRAPLGSRATPLLETTQNRWAWAHPPGLELRVSSMLSVRIGGLAGALAAFRAEVALRVSVPRPLSCLLRRGGSGRGRRYPVRFGVCGGRFAADDRIQRFEKASAFFRLRELANGVVSSLSYACLTFLALACEYPDPENLSDPAKAQRLCADGRSTNGESWTAEVRDRGRLRRQPSGFPRGAKPNVGRFAEDDRTGLRQLR